MTGFPQTTTQGLVSTRAALTLKDDTAQRAGHQIWQGGTQTSTGTCILRCGQHSSPTLQLKDCCDSPDQEWLSACKACLGSRSGICFCCQQLRQHCWQGAGMQLAISMTCPECPWHKLACLGYMNSCQTASCSKSSPAPKTVLLVCVLLLLLSARQC